MAMQYWAAAVVCSVASYSRLASACSPGAFVQGCSFGNGPAVSACMAAFILQGQVLQTGMSSAKVSVSRIILGGTPQMNGGRQLGYGDIGREPTEFNPVVVTIQGFGASSLCMTPSPGSGSKALFFVNYVRESEYELSGFAFGENTAQVSKLADVLKGADHKNCTILSCEENPLCVRPASQGGLNCPVVLASSPAPAAECVLLSSTQCDCDNRVQVVERSCMRDGVAVSADQCDEPCGTVSAPCPAMLADACRNDVD